MPDVAAIRTAIANGIEDLKQQPGVRMYLVTKTGDEDNPYRVFKLEPTGEVPSHLRSALSTELADAADHDDRQFKDFLDPHRNPHDILFARTENIAGFSIILNQINQHPSLTPPPNIQYLGKVWGYAVEVDNARGRIIYFRKFTGTKLIGRAKEDGKWVGKLSSEGKLTYLDGNILTFDQKADCVYLETLESVMVPPPHYVFESMFEFRVFYEKETTKVMDRLSRKALLVFGNAGIVGEALQKRRLIRKVAELSHDGFFTRFEAGDITTFFFEATKKQIGEKITYVITDGKIGIPDVDALGAFVDACSEKYVKSMAGYRKGMNPRIYMADFKEPI